MKFKITTVVKKKQEYKVIVFKCPGCEDFGFNGIHQLPINTEVVKPSWSWDGDLLKPTLSPSILSKFKYDMICHSFIKEGMIKFLPDSTHTYAGQTVELMDLPGWLIE